MWEMGQGFVFCLLYWNFVLMTFIQPAFHCISNGGLTQGTPNKNFICDRSRAEATTNPQITIALNFGEVQI